MKDKHLSAILLGVLSELDRPTPFYRDGPMFHNKEKVIPKGHKPFVIDGVEVYALNKKNAIKKAAKLKGS